MAQTNLFPVRRLPSQRPLRRVARGVENPFEMPERFGDDDDDDGAPLLCPVSLSDSFDMIRAINNFRITQGVAAINISRSLMSTACAHMRDILASHDTINDECGLHSWSSCCYPSDHSNPNCMHRKALQVTTSLKWNIYNVAAYELAYEWAGGAFSAIRALDMFVSNPDHKTFILQHDSWTEFKWRSIGAAVGQRYAYIWFGTLEDPNGDFSQFDVENHVMELPGCVCTGTPITWRPPATLSPDEALQLQRKQRLKTVPTLYQIEAGQEEVLPAPTALPADATTQPDPAEDEPEQSRPDPPSTTTPIDDADQEPNEGEPDEIRVEPATTQPANATDAPIPDPESGSESEPHSSGLAEISTDHESAKDDISTFNELWKQLTA